jgi:hypothetical protein
MSNNNTSGWEKLSAMATLVQALVVIVSIVLIKSQLSLQTAQLNLQTDQLKAQTRLTQAANLQALSALVIPMNLEEVKDAETVRLLFRGARGFEKGEDISGEDIKKEQYRTLLATWLIFYENMFYQHSQKVLADEVYAPWDKDLQNFVIDNNLQKYWPDMKDAYHEDFRNHIDRVIRRNKPVAAQ